MSNEPTDSLSKAGSDSAETKNNSNGNPEDRPPKTTDEMREEKNKKREKLREKEHKIADRVAGRTRFVATVPSIGLLIASIVLAIGTIVDLVLSSMNYVFGDLSLHELTIEYVEYADSFLLAVALYILSIGLTSLFVSENIPLPKWLDFHDFDDLKERLTSVIIVMIGVSFLGHVLKGTQGLDTLWLGLGCAAIIIALSLFMRAVFKSKE